MTIKEKMISIGCTLSDLGLSEEDGNREYSIMEAVKKISNAEYFLLKNHIPVKFKYMIRSTEDVIYALITPERDLAEMICK